MSWLKKPPSVRLSLAALVVSCVLPIAGVASFLIVDFYAREQTQLVNSTIARARVLMSAIDREINGTQAALQALGTSRQLAEGDMAGFHERATEVLRNLRADSIVLVAPDGKLLLSTRRPFGDPLPKVPNPSLLRRIVASGDPGVSDLFVGPIGGQMIYTVGVPIRRNGKVAMTLNATATPVQLARFLAGQKLPDNWRGSIIDSSGQVVARTHDGEKFTGRAINPELLAQLNSADEGSFETTSLDGIAVLTAYSRSPLNHWTVIFGIPTDSLKAGLHRTLAWLVLVTLAACAAGLALAWRIGGGIVQSVHALIEPARAVVWGETHHLPLLKFEEANQLGGVLQDAARSVIQARAEARESEQRLALVAEAAQLGIWVRDLQQHTIWVSDEWRRLFGFDPSQQIELSDLLAQVHPDDRASVKQTLANAELGIPRYDMEFRLLPTGGEQRWIGSHGSVESDTAGRPALVRGVSLDITARKQAELAIQQKQKEVMHLSRVAMLGELSGALAHELNQPLTAILSNAQAAQRFMARDPVDLVEVREILQDIVDEDQRAGEIIRRLRKLFDKDATSRQRVDVAELVQGVARILHNDLINHDIALVLENTPQAIVISADQVQLQQVLINLVLNACDAMEQTPKDAREVRIQIHALPDKQVAITVADRGPGIRKDMLEQVFDPFFTTKARGMGLGLSICRNIVAAHGGQLSAENSPAGGARFLLTLPLNREAD